MRQIPSQGLLNKVNDLVGTDYELFFKIGSKSVPVGSLDDLRKEYRQDLRNFIVGETLGGRMVK